MTTEIQIDAPRLIRELPADFKLRHGSHSSFAQGACLMEAVAYVAGLPHSDEPECTSRVLTRIATRLNDRYTDEERQLLAPLIPLLVGTRTSPEIDLRRAYAMVDAAVREIVPMAMDAIGRAEMAGELRALAPIVDRDSAVAARVTCSSVRDRARASASASASSASAYAASAYAYAYAYDASAYAYAAAAAAADAAADAAYAAAAADAAADARKASRRPIVEATIAAFRRVIGIAS